MKVLLQRVSEARVRLAGSGEITGEIGKGILVLVCSDPDDGKAETDLLVRKIANMRFFEDADGKMNLSVRDVGGGLLVVSQFTLAADWRRGNRPGFSRAADPETAERDYDDFCERLRGEEIPVATGRFGADMRVELVNDGPVTIWMDTRAPK